MLAFTKGKWVYADVSTPYEQNFIIGTLDPNGVFFALGSARNEANARFITAAPDMYRILCNIQNFCVNYDLDPDIEQDIHEVLQKIDGKEGEA